MAMFDYNVKIGLVAMRRNTTDRPRGTFLNWYSAEQRGEKFTTYIQQNFTSPKVSCVDNKGIAINDLVFDDASAKEVVARFKEEQVDAVMIINCNFGNEEACGRVAREMGLPVLLWGPQDMVFEPNGQRYTDCQCGLFAISKQLKRSDVPFSYIENSPVESEIFREGFVKFLSVATMVKNFKNLAITQVGTRLNPFKSMLTNELELTEKFGFNMQTVNMAVVTDKFNKLYASNAVELCGDVEKLKEQYDVADLTDEQLKKMLTFVYVYKEIFEETDADVLATECWTSMPLAVGANPCLAMSILYDMGYIVACESDVCGAVTCVLLRCAARGKEAPLFGEFTVRHPENKNAELLWHCGPFPYSTKAEDSTAKLFNTKPSFRAKDGNYTLARFQGERGKYKLLGGNYHTIEGPHTFGTYMWAEFKDMSKLEKKLIYGPYVHHMTEIYGEYADVLEEFCQYIPELEFDPLED